MYWPTRQYEYEQPRFGSRNGVDSVAFPVHFAETPGKTVSSFCRKLRACAVTAGSVDALAYGDAALNAAGDAAARVVVRGSPAHPAARA